MIPTHVEGYRLTREIGNGGMGRVFEAVHESTSERAAIKILHGHFAESRDLVGRFLNEARAVEIINHPGLVKVRRAGQLPNGAPYLIMEYLEGESLQQRLRRNSHCLAPGKALQIGQEVAAALAAAHEKDIIHRDLKPDNIMLVKVDKTSDLEQVKVFDFGIAKLRPEHMDEDRTEIQTQRGQLMGTPTYMSPEQCLQGKVINGKADVYALGAVLYQCLSGRPPFVPTARGDARIVQLCAMHLSAQVQPLSELVPQLPHAITALIHSMLEKTPEARPSMIEVARILASFPMDQLPLSVTTTAPALTSADMPTMTPTSRFQEPQGGKRHLILLGLAAAWIVAWGLFVLLTKHPGP